MGCWEGFVDFVAGVDAVGECMLAGKVLTGSKRQERCGVALDGFGKCLLLL